MAEANFDAFGPGGESRAGTLGLTMNVAGALVMLALLGGLGLWGYRLAVRDAHGVPVVRALSGPVRIAPEDPGGRVADNAGLAVNRIAGGGGVDDLPEQIVLAPAPVMLEVDDAPGIGAAAPPPPAVVAAEEDSFARTLALAEELARQAAAEIAAEEGAAPVLAGARVQHSPRPRPRPVAGSGADLAAGAIAHVVPVVATLAAEIAPEGLTPGMRLAQIGAFDDVASARAEWERVVARHPTLFADKSRVVQPVDSVGRLFYRLQVAGFANEDESRQFCHAVESGDLRCVPVTVR